MTTPARDPRGLLERVRSRAAPSCYTRSEFAELLGVGASTVSRWIKLGRVAYDTAEGATPLFSREAVVSFLEEDYLAPPAPKAAS